MSHIFLYATACETGPPSAALDAALGHMHTLVLDLEATYPFVSVRGQSHTLTPQTITTGPVLPRTDAGYLAAVTTAVEVQEVTR